MSRGRWKVDKVYSSSSAGSRRDKFVMALAVGTLQCGSAHPERKYAML